MGEARRSEESRGTGTAARPRSHRGVAATATAGRAPLTAVETEEGGSSPCSLDCVLETWKAGEHRTHVAKEQATVSVFVGPRDATAEPPRRLGGQSPRYTIRLYVCAYTYFYNLKSPSFFPKWQ